MRMTVLLAMFALLFPGYAFGQGHIADIRLPPVQEPPANIRLTFHLIEADGYANEDPEIAAVVTELRRIFRFRGYRLAFTSVLNASPTPIARNPSVVGGIDSHASVSQRTTDLQGREFRVIAEITTVGEQVRVGVELRGYGADGASRDLISASVNLTSGKTVVLGSTRTDASSGALILVVTAVLDP